MYIHIFALALAFAFASAIAGIFYLLLFSASVGSASGRGIKNCRKLYYKQRRSLHVIVGPLVGHINNIFGLNLSGGSVSISMSFLRICCSHQRKSKQKTWATNATATATATVTDAQRFRHL